MLGAFSKGYIEGLKYHYKQIYQIDCIHYRGYNCIRIEVFAVMGKAGY